jgi:hypothetical protein
VRGEEPVVTGNRFSWSTFITSSTSTVRRRRKRRRRGG